MVVGPAGAAFTARQRGILASKNTIALAARDHASTAWLRGVVVTRDWPKRSEAGEVATKSVWLLVQHADADLPFQVRALSAMKPPVEAGEADRRRYARLYDQAMLKLTGVQHYATQLTCRRGRYVPQPLKAGNVDERRRWADLDPLAEYQPRALKENGACT